MSNKGIKSINVNTTGLVGDQVNPRRCTMISYDNLATIITPGYLNGEDSSGNPILPTDIFDVIYDFDEGSQQGTFGIFQLTYSSSTGWTLVIWEDQGNVLFPVIDGHVAVFNGTSGQIRSNPESSPSPAVNYGPFRSESPTLNKGYLELSSADNSGNFGVQISNGTFAQSSTVFIPDPGQAVSTFILDAGQNQMALGSTLFLAKGVGTESGNAVTINAQSGVITTSSLTTAGGSSYTISLTNFYIAVNSVIVISWMGGTNSVGNISLRATSGSGNSTITIFNNTASTALNGTLILGFSVF